MDRTFELNASIQPPAPPANPSNGYPVGGDPRTGTPPTKAGPWWYHMVTEELRNVVANAGIAHDHTNLQQLSQAIQSSQLNSAVASNDSPTAIEAVFQPPIGKLINGLTVHVRAKAANTTTTPSFTPASGNNNIPPQTIVRNANIPLVPGDIAGDGHWLTLKYDALLTKWVLLNPLGDKTNFVQVGSVHYFANSTAPNGYLKANGTAVSRSTYAGLFAAIGATFGAGDGSTTFNLPDLRGEFLRGWDDGRGVDAGRNLGSNQLDQFQNHGHDLVYPYTGSTGGQLSAGLTSFTATGMLANYAGNPRAYGTGGTPRVGAETRPRNIALLACIKY